MRKAGLILLLGLCACGRAGELSSAAASPKTAAPGPVNPDPGVRAYRCDDGRTVEAGYPDRDTAVVEVDGHAYTLKAQRAASGVRYVGFGLQWWTKGMDEARLSRLKGDETVTREIGVLCRSGPGVSAPDRR